jgi:hypothetical protein|tara:strand:+ start:159 stop:290 length:132 start_codon:yes stop_codon:yes gene_type:complete
MDESEVMNYFFFLVRTQIAMPTATPIPITITLKFLIKKSEKKV